MNSKTTNEIYKIAKNCVLQIEALFSSCTVTAILIPDTVSAGHIDFL
jgi:hypothetical protein